MKLKGPKKALIEMKTLHTFLACVLCSKQQQTLSKQGLWSCSEPHSLESILWLRLSLGTPVVPLCNPASPTGAEQQEPSGEYGIVCGDSQVVPGTQCGDCHHGNHISPSYMSASEGRHCCPCQNPSFWKC